MNINEFVNGLAIRPIFKGIEYNLIKDGILAQIPVAINRIVSRYPFHFATKKTTIDGGTVIGQSDYECTDGVMDILSIRYGTNKDLLEELTDYDMDDEKTWSQTTSSSTSNANVYAWARLSDDSGVIKFRLFQTPDSASNAIEYKYIRNDVAFSEFPIGWMYVLQDAVMACLGDIGIAERGEIIALDNTRKFEKSLHEMINHYDKRGGNPMPVRQGREIRNRNILRNQKHGY